MVDFVTGLNRDGGIAIGGMIAGVGGFAIQPSHCLTLFRKGWMLFFGWGRDDGMAIGFEVACVDGFLTRSSISSTSCWDGSVLFLPFVEGHDSSPSSRPRFDWSSDTMRSGAGSSKIRGNGV